MLGSLILYLKGMRIMMFQLSGYYYIVQQLRTLDTEDSAEKGDGILNYWALLEVLSLRVSKTPVKEHRARLKAP